MFSKSTSSVVERKLGNRAYQAVQWAATPHPTAVRCLNILASGPETVLIKSYR